MSSCILGSEITLVTKCNSGSVMTRDLKKKTEINLPPSLPYMVMCRKFLWEIYWIFSKIYGVLYGTWPYKMQWAGVCVGGGGGELMPILHLVSPIPREHDSLVDYHDDCTTIIMPWPWACGQVVVHYGH